MSKFASFVLVLVLVAVACARPQSSSTTAPDCMANSTPITSRGDPNCVLNCQNYANRGSLACNRRLYFGNFCLCSEGHVFKSGTAGECVPIADCPK